MLTSREKETVDYYNQNAAVWAGKRKTTSEPSFWQAEYEIFKALRPPQGKVIEIGSGSGREALELCVMGYDYVGVDASSELLKIAKKTNPSGSFFEAVPYRLPFDPQTFDAVFSWALLPHTPKDRIGEALEEIKRVLKPGAIGFFAMREGEGERQEPGTTRWFSYYQEEEFEKILQAHGFTVEKKAKKPSRPGLTWLTFFVRNR
jgi:ubiquinone/menaquinone biosynthesis C-methylase UbiE